MARSWRRDIYGPWLLALLPIAVLSGAVFWRHAWIAALIIWWLKPLFDRVILAVISRRFFGERPTPIDLIRHLGTYLGTGIITDLTLRRLSPFRSYLMPVHQLERLDSGTRRKRAEVLGGKQLPSAAQLTAVFLVFELCVVLSLMALSVLFIPDELRASLDLDQSHPWLGAVLYAFYVATVALLEPFYVGAGFSLYINRRVELEGWDIELGFRRLARRLSKGAAAMVVVWATTSTPAQAASTPEAVASCTRPCPDSSAAIQDVLSDPVFGTTEVREGWKLRKGDDERWDWLELDGFSGIGSALASVFVWIVAVVALVGLIAFVGIYLQRRLSESAETRGESAPAQTVAGLDIRPESLPKDILRAARKRWAEGFTIGALSLLYRGSLAMVVHERRVRIPASSTEEECLRAAKDRLDEPFVHDFEILTRTWQRLAYGGLPPTEEGFSDLCQRLERYLRRTS